MSDKRTQNRKYGDAGEFLARVYLLLHGASILERNYRRAFGEIDIIAEFEGRVCFVEVKRRSSRAFGSPAQAVTAAKRRHIVKCASAYMRTKGWLERPARFDVAQIDGIKITYIRDAFDASV